MAGTTLEQQLAAAEAKAAELKARIAAPKIEEQRKNVAQLAQNVLAEARVVAKANDPEAHAQQLFDAISLYVPAIDELEKAEEILKALPPPQKRPRKKKEPAAATA